MEKNIPDSLDLILLPNKSVDVNNNNSNDQKEDNNTLIGGSDGEFTIDPDC